MPRKNVWIERENSSGRTPMPGASLERTDAAARRVEEVVGHPGHVLRRGPFERAGEQGDESADGGRFARHVGMDVHLAVLQFDPEEHRRLALVHPVVVPLLFLLQPLGQGRELAGVVEERLQPGGAIGGLEAGDDGLEARHWR